MTNTTETYVALITAEHKDKPNFIATVELRVSVYAQIQKVLEQMIDFFDLDKAYGVGLDMIGLWVNAPRNVQIPIVGIYFAWDDTDSDGWEFGVWQGAFDPSTGTIPLPDDVYKMLIRGKIAANQWDGTTPGMYDVWAVAFPGHDLVVQDNQNMSMIIGVAGVPLDSLTKALLVAGYIPLKPEGVRVNYTFVTIEAPLFGWDISTPEVDGWGTGAWGEEF